MSTDLIHLRQGSQPSYYDVVAEQYDGISSSNVHLAENAILQGILEQSIFGKRSHIQRVLDLGCGTGLGYEIINKIVDNPRAVVYEGHDISTGMLDVFRRKHGKSVNLKVTDCNAMDWKRTYRDIDLILMTFGSFSYIDSPDKFLAEMRSILTPGNGHIALMGYSRYSIRNRLQAESTGDQTYLAAHRPYAFRNDTTECEKTPAHFYTAQDLEEMAIRAGFESVAVQGMNFNTVCEEDCPTMDVAITKLTEEMRAATCQNDAHALILSGRNYA